MRSRNRAHEQRQGRGRGYSFFCGLTAPPWARQLRRLELGKLQRPNQGPSINKHGQASRGRSGPRVTARKEGARIEVWGRLAGRWLGGSDSEGIGGRGGGGGKTSTWNNARPSRVARSLVLNLSGLHSAGAHTARKTPPDQELGQQHARHVLAPAH